MLHQRLNHHPGGVAPRIQHYHEADSLGLPNEEMHVDGLDNKLIGNEKYRTVAERICRIVNLCN